MVRLALDAGKHVISEKPIGPDEAVARKLVRDYQTIYQPRGLIWSVAENYRYEPAFEQVLQIVFLQQIQSIFRIQGVSICERVRTGNAERAALPLPDAKK